MSSQQTATFRKALAILESLPEYQQDDLMHIMQRRRLARRHCSQSVSRKQGQSIRGERSRVAQ